MRVNGLQGINRVCLDYDYTNNEWMVIIEDSAWHTVREPLESYDSIEIWEETNDN